MAGSVFPLVRMISSLYFPLCCFIPESSCLTTISKNTDEATLRNPESKTFSFNFFHSEAESFGNVLSPSPFQIKDQKNPLGGGQLFKKMKGTENI